MLHTENSDNLITRSETRRAWRLVSIAGALGMLYRQGIQSAPFTKFLEIIGFSDSDFALLSAIGSVALFFQIASGRISAGLQNRKRLWMILIFIARFLVLLLLVAPVFQESRLRVLWILGIILFHHSLDNMAQPIWFSWMADIVPKETLSRHWASRQRVIHTARIFVMIAIIVGVWLFETVLNQMVLGYSILLVVAVVSGLIDITLFRTIPDPPTSLREKPSLLEMIRLPLEDDVFRPFLVFLCSWKLAIALAMPLIGIYVLRHLEMSTTELQILMTVQAVTIVISSRFWGVVCDALGHRTVIQFSAFGRLLMVVLLMLTPPGLAVSFVLALFAFFFEGLAMGGIMVSFQTARLQLSPRENRPIYIGTINLFSMGFAQLLGSFIAWAVLESIEGNIRLQIGPIAISHFHVAFGISLILGSIAWLQAGKIGDENDQPFLVLIRQLFEVNPFLVIRAVVRLDKSSDPKVRVRAARRLGALRARLGLMELASALDDEDEHVRLAAANALGRIASCDVTPHLTRALSDEAPQVQRHAVRGLARIGDDESLRTLIRNLYRVTPLALSESVQAVGRIGNDAAVLPLLDLFQRTRRHWLRQDIARALSQLSGDESPEEILKKLCESEKDFEQDYSEENDPATPPPDDEQ